MKKQVITWHGKKYYLLGADQRGIKYYLEEASWDCNWYWSIGYVETFTNNNNPALSRDIASHEHFDGIVFNDKYTNLHKAFTARFVKHVFKDDKELWTLLELMRSLYHLRAYSDFLYRRGSHMSANPYFNVIKNEEEYERINKKLIPLLLNHLYDLLTPEK